MEKIHGFYQPEVSFSLEEAAGDSINGTPVLAKVKGVFFVPDGTSRNERFYPRELWERCLQNANIRKRIQDKRMFGTISHEQALDDKAVLEGKISHIVSSLKIENNQGIGEALILDTPAGKILNTLLRAGSKLFVSSRANGDYSGKTTEGIPIVNPLTYLLETFDFVLEPGFLQANPGLSESINKILQETKVNTKGANQMDELNERLMKENFKVKTDLQEAINQVEKLKAENATLKNAEADLSESNTKLDEASKLISQYQALGTVEEIAKLIEVADAKFEAYAKLGTPAKIQSRMKAMAETLKKYSALGTPEQVSKALDASGKLIEKYREFGKLSELNAVFEKMERFGHNLKASKDEAKQVKLAEELKVPVAAVKALWGKANEAEIRKTLTGIKESVKITSKFRKTVTESKAPKKTSNAASPFEKNSAERLMESMCK